MRKTKPILLCTLLVLVLTVACTGTFDLQVETTPGPEATITALEAKAADLSTRVAVAEPSPTPVVDQSQLAYVRGGDLWVRSLPDGAPRRLTENGRSTNPLWSPSGKWLAYLEDTGLRTIAIGEETPHLIGDPVNQVAWSPTQDRLAYLIGSGILRLIVVNPDGTDERILLPNERTADGQVGRIAWSPDGAWIAYEWRENLGAHGLWKIPADGGEPIAVYDSGIPQQGEALLAGWTADGAYLLFWQGELISASMLADGVPVYAVPADGGEPVELASDVLYHADFIAPAPGQATDAGPRVALIEGGGRGTWTNKALRVVELQDGGAEVLAPTTTSNRAATSPAWSPDGARIAYAAMPDHGDLGGGDDAIEGLMARRLWVVDVTGRDPHPVTDHEAFRDELPHWSADGTRLLFARMDTTGVLSLWWMSVDDGTPAQLVDEIGPVPGPADPQIGYYGHAAWASLFDWWRGLPATGIVSSPAPSPTSEPQSPPQAQTNNGTEGAFDTARTALEGYEHPPTEAGRVVEALALDIAQWLGAGHDPAELRAALGGLPKLESAHLTVSSMDLNGDGISDVVVEPRFIGLSVLGCLAVQSGSYTCQPLPAPSAFGDHALTMDSGVLSQDLIGDGRPETVITYTLQGGSGWTELLYVFRWSQPTWSEQVFRAALINWAGRSTWRLEQDPASRQRYQIVLTYPKLYPIDHKQLNHPVGRQVWRWDRDAGQFALAEQTVDLDSSAWEAGMEVTMEDKLRWLTNEAETAFRAAAYKEALAAYDGALAFAEAQDWQPTGDLPDWPGFLRFRRGQTLAYLGEGSAARETLQAVAGDYADDLLGEVAAAFLSGYGDGTGDDAAVEAARALHALNEPLRDHFYNERPGALRFPIEAHHILCCEPGSRVATAYDGASWPQVGGLDAGP